MLISHALDCGSCRHVCERVYGEGGSIVIVEVCMRVCIGEGILVCVIERVF